MEGGVNLRKDVTGAGRFRLKLDVYNTKVDDYITGRQFVGVWQFNNIGAVRLKGVEADASYGDRWGSVSIDGSLGTAERETGVFDGSQLSNAPLDRVTASLQLNALKRINYGTMVMYVNDKARNTSSAPTAPVAPEYTLAYLFAKVRVTDWLDAHFNVDNLFNRSYSDPEAQYVTTGASSFQGRGRTFKFNLIVRLHGG